LGQKSIAVLRIGHRYVRDYRTLTHLCLVARALGAEGIYLEEFEDGLLETIESVNETWGPGFEVWKAASWRAVMGRARKEGRTSVHLTMYGLPMQDVIGKLRNADRFLLVVGGPKVPGEVYRTADYNVSVTSQPHSEIAALAIFMHELQSGEELKREFGGSKIKIIPSEKGKKVESLS